MSDNPYETPTSPTPPPAWQPGPPAAAPYGFVSPATGPVGRIRPTGMAIFLFVITLGIYSWFWFYYTFDELKRHKGDGLGGGMALLLMVLGIFVGVTGLVLPFLSSSEVGQLYERRGQQKPVSGLTGLWYFPGIFIIVGPIVWFVQTNGALNRYWESLGVTR